jgi:hypothetical protein
MDRYGHIWAVVTCNRVKPTVCKWSQYDLHEPHSSAHIMPIAVYKHIQVRLAVFASDARLLQNFATNWLFQRGWREYNIPKRIV